MGLTAVFFNILDVGLNILLKFFRLGISVGDSLLVGQPSDRLVQSHKGKFVGKGLVRVLRVLSRQFLVDGVRRKPHHPLHLRRGGDEGIFIARDLYLDVLSHS